MEYSRVGSQNDYVTPQDLTLTELDLNFPYKPMVTYTLKLTTPAYILRPVSVSPTRAPAFFSSTFRPSPSNWSILSVTVTNR